MGPDAEQFSAFHPSLTNAVEPTDFHSTKYFESAVKSHDYMALGEGLNSFNSNIFTSTHAVKKSYYLYVIQKSYI